MFIRALERVEWSVVVESKGKMRNEDIYRKVREETKLPAVLA